MVSFYYYCYHHHHHHHHHHHFYYYYYYSTDKYLSFFNTPLVIFVKDKLSQVVFIAFHVRVCILASTVYPRFEEYLIFLFSTGVVLNECQQYKASPLKYFK